MALRALNMEPTSPSPLPEDTSASTNGDAPTEPTATPEAVPAKSSGGNASYTKPPAASLVSIAVKNKPTAPAKTGDLTRFFELARRQPMAASAPSQPPSVEATATVAVPLESAVAPTPAAPTPIELPSIAVSPEPAPLETAPSPAEAEPSRSAGPAVFDAALPLVLAPPSAAEIEDTAASAVIEPVPAPEGNAVSLPERVEPASADERASLPKTETLEHPHEEPEAARAIAEPAQEERAPAASAASAAAVEPTSMPVEPPHAPEPDPPPTAVVAPVEPRPAPAVPPAHRFKELVDYWRSLRGGDDHPAEASIDRDLVTERWPGALLISYTPASQDPRGELRPGRVTRLGTACAETQSVVDAGSHSTEWMLEVARTALVNDEPVEEQQRLPTISGVAGFRMVALPFGPPRGLANGVLCTLVPSPAAPRFGKRRTWL
jgi:hypothetical protein